MGGIYGYGYNVYVWLVSVVIRRYVDILIIIIDFPYSTCTRSFFGSSILTSLFIFKMFFWSCFRYFFTMYSKLIEHSRSFKKNRDPANIKIIKLYP